MIFVDSTEPSEIESVFGWGVPSGVTTNPLIFARQAGSADLEARIRQILAVSRGPVSVEVPAADEDEMLAEARRYARWDPDRICIKVPFGEPGLRVANRLDGEGIAVNLTCVMSFPQGYLAALAGARFVSIFSGRVRDTGYDVRPTIAKLRGQIDREGLATKIIVGSIRHLMDVAEALEAGAHVITVSPAILRQMLHHPKTDEVVAQFSQAWNDRGEP